jgi:hypothetical protein
MTITKLAGDVLPGRHFCVCKWIRFAFTACLYTARSDQHTKRSAVKVQRNQDAPRVKFAEKYPI